MLSVTGPPCVSLARVIATPVVLPLPTRDAPEIVPRRATVPCVGDLPGYRGGARGSYGCRGGSYGCRDGSYGCRDGSCGCRDGS
ncbi:hypothetical protein GCM10010383_48190 [Streptomyces lomondensis]|uniref:Uncharacterized protein n=1 Tax=Streptomyces lomondensis TaxID=68229 RepID=A0ABQ2XDR0_9ACTN|nr:hypothetical protein GCM10010383_48190 [Streptomyces lomondensis]